MDTTLTARIESALEELSTLTDLATEMSRSIRQLANEARHGTARQDATFKVARREAPPVIHTKEEIDADRVASILDRPVGTIYTWHAQGILRGKKVGRRLVFDLDKVTRFMTTANEQHKRQPNRRKGGRRGG